MEGKSADGKETEGTGEGAIRRTQSSLQLLSDTALAAMGGSDRSEEQEEASSDVSARVTPSLSQSASQASMGVGTATNTGGEREQQPEAASSEPSPTQKESVTKPTDSQKIIPASPHRGNHNDPQPSAAPGSLGEMPGLPIDQYAGRPAGAYAAPTPQRMYLPDSYMPQPESYMHQPHFYHAPPGPVPLLRPPPRESRPPTFGPGGPNMATHAAFVPPRSSAARPPSSNGEISTGPPVAAPTAPTHYQSFGPPGMGQHHAMGALGHQQYMTSHHPDQQHGAHHHHHLLHQVRALNPCESFQSDSTASLVSESKFPGVPKMAMATVGSNHHAGDTSSQEKNVPVINSLAGTSGAPRSGGQGGEMLDSAQQLRQENIELKHELEKRDKEIMVLRGEVRELDLKVKELRQFPAGKISQIPMADMLEIMQIYGSEVSDTVMPPRKLNIQKASVIRQFRRWNPNFLKFFYFKDGKWMPKLGRDGELARRQQTRKKGQKGGVNAGEQSPSTSSQNLQALHMTSPISHASALSATPDAIMPEKPTLSPGSSRKRKAHHSPTGGKKSPKHSA